MTTKQLLGKLHTWIGLVSAPIVFFICITGTIIVFCDEIMDFSAGDARYVKEVLDEKIPTEKILDIIQQEMPGYLTSYAVYSRNPERSIRINCYNKDEGLRMVFVDQYTGEILKKDKAIYFFYILAHLHGSFLWHGPGNWIVYIATMLFLIVSITGLVIWWPRNWGKKYRKAIFTIKTNANKKRLNYDLHKVLGFYGLGVSLLLIVTGLIIAFHPLSGALKEAFGGDADPKMSMRHYFDEMPRDSTLVSTPINTVVDNVFATFPDKEYVQFRTFTLDLSDYYILTVANQIGLLSAQDAKEMAYYKSTGKAYDLPDKLQINSEVENAYWTLHMGNYIGIWGKILTFIAGLIVSSLPVTGFIIWNGRRKQSL